MNNTLLYVSKWIYSRSYCHWYVRRFKYIWHNKTIELTEVGWFCWYQSWLGSLSTVNWQNTEINELPKTNLSWLCQKTHSLAGLPAAVFNWYAWKRERTIWSSWSTHACVALRTAYTPKGHKRWLGCFSTQVHAEKGGLVPLLRPVSVQMRASKEKLRPSL